MARPTIPPVYRLVMAIAAPIVRGWGRLQVVGEEVLPLTGPVLLVSNHDSHWDPVVIGVAGLRRRQVCALAKASLWKNPISAWVLDRMGQIPIERGRGDSEALDAAAASLQAGSCIGVFPEGTISRGRPTRAHSGAGRLALLVPDTQIVCARVIGAVDIVRFPKRPRVQVEFFRPVTGQVGAGESAVKLAKRLTTEIREQAPPALPGRRKKAARYLAEGGNHSPA